jgi:hypothetical protein
VHVLVYNYVNVYRLCYRYMNTCTGYGEKKERTKCKLLMSTWMGDSGG